MAFLGSCAHLRFSQPIVSKLPLVGVFVLQTFAILSGVHSIVSCYLKKVRGKEDGKHPPFCFFRYVAHRSFVKNDSLQALYLQSLLFAGLVQLGTQELLVALLV